jgi:adenylate kinase
LVPDDLTLKIVENRFLEDDCKEGFLLDGFPRTLIQAEALDKELEIIENKLRAVINLEVSDRTILERMTSRRVCSNCGENYNLSFFRPVLDEICDKCGGQLYTREDDKLETVESRLSVYKNQTFPLIDYYKEKGILVTVNGEQHVDKVFDDIISALERFE